jgi:hypothetical protein
MYSAEENGLLCGVAKKSDAKKRALGAENILFSESEFMSWGRLVRDAGNMLRGSCV